MLSKINKFINQLSSTNDNIANNNNSNNNNNNNTSNNANINKNNNTNNTNSGNNNAQLAKGISIVDLPPGGGMCLI